MFRRKKSTRHIDGKKAVPVGKAGLLDRPFDLSPRRVHEDVEFSAFPIDARHRRPCLVLRSDVEAYKMAIVSGPGQCALLRQICSKHLSAFAQEAGADRASYS